MEVEEFEDCTLGARIYFIESEANLAQIAIGALPVFSLVDNLIREDDNLSALEGSMSIF